jgi:hypothetical protein
MLLAGTLYEVIGVASYGAMAITALVGALITAAVWMRMADAKA